MAVEAVLDTNVILQYFGGRLVTPLPGTGFVISVITEMELLSYPSLDVREEQRIVEFLQHVDVIDLNVDVRDAAIRIRRAHRLRLPDAIIAGTALVLDAELLATDRRLANVPDLRCHAVEMRDN